MATITEPGVIAEEQAVTLDPWRLAASTLLGVAALMSAVALVGYFFREPMERAALVFVQTLGGLGVAVGYFLPDAFAVPLPNDVFTVLGVAGGMGFGEVVFWGTVGSLAGGSTGYVIGRSLRATAFVARLLSARGGHVQRLLGRYGVAAVAVAAITPIPYSISCWAAGAGEIPFGRFFLVSQLRVLRVAGYLYLIQLGL